VKGFLSKVKISNETLYCKELKVKHHKTILKSLFGDTPDYESAFYNISTILAELTDLTFEQITHLNVIDYFLLLFEVRSLSIGSTIAAETTGEKVIKIKLNINKFGECLKNINITDLLASETIDDFIIEYKLPTVQDIVNIDINTQETIYNLFVKTLTIKTLCIDLTTLDNKTDTTLAAFVSINPSTASIEFEVNGQVIKSFNQYFQGGKKYTVLAAYSKQYSYSTYFVTQHN